MKNWTIFTISVYMSEMRYYLHFSNYCPHLCWHVYHNVSAIVRSGLLQVVGISNLTLYFAYRGRLFLFHKPCLMDVSYLLLISPLKVLHCLHRVLNSHSLGMSLDLTNAFIHCTMCPWGHLCMNFWVLYT